MDNIFNAITKAFTFWNKHKRRLEAAHDVATALESLSTEYERALADGKVTKAELSNLMGRLNDLVVSLKSVVG